MSQSWTLKFFCTLAVGIFSFCCRFWIKKGLNFLKSLTKSGVFTSIKEAFIEKRLMSFMFGSIYENPELKRQIWNKFCEWRLNGAIEFFWENCSILKMEMEMSANAQGLCVHQNQWLLHFSVFMSELQQEITKYKIRGWDLGDWETKLELIVQNAEQWVECQFVSGAEAIEALRMQVSEMPIQKIDHVMSLMREQLVQSQNQQGQVCRCLENVVVQLEDLKTILKEAFAKVQSGGQNLYSDEPSSSTAKHLVEP